MNRLPSDTEIDDALRRLAHANLPELTSRRQLSAAEQRLHRAARPSAWIERWEPPLLVTFAASHLIWALLHVLAGRLG